MKLRIPSKLLGWSLVLSFIAAIAVGKMCGPTPALRSFEPVRFVGVPIPRNADSSAPTRFLDLETGETSLMKLPDGDSLSVPACSPWRDENGQRQVVGRWMNRTGEHEQSVTTEFGLARYTYPEGEPLNRVATDVLPEGTPCWYPESRARILFASTHGTLFRFSFEGSKAPDASPEGCDARPTPIVWKVAPPGEDERSVHIADPIWPEGRRFGGRVIVSLRILVRDGQSVQLSPPRLWSLLLDTDGGAIIAASPLHEDSHSGADAVRERFPKTGRGEDGRDRITFLSKRKNMETWDLKVATIRLAGDGSPRFVEEPQTLAEAISGFAPPAMSLDGRWVYYHPAGPLAVGVPRVLASPNRTVVER